MSQRVPLIVVVIVILSTAQVSAKGIMLMNRIDPSVSELSIANADGSGERKLFAASGFDFHPSFSADGQWIVFTSERNGPGQADIYRVHPDGQRILFTRRHGGENFDIFTVRSDGSDLQQLRTSPASDAHGAWTADGKQIFWNSAMFGWRGEAALYERTFQPYGQIFLMNADGSGKRQVTGSLWEDSMPVYVPEETID